MADKPSRALVLFGYGLAPHITTSHSHFHALASRGCCGFLAFEDSSPTPDAMNMAKQECRSNPEDVPRSCAVTHMFVCPDLIKCGPKGHECMTEVDDAKLIRELAQLLDANESFFTANEKDVGSEASKQVSSIKERFMGMRAALVTSSHAAKCFGEKLGFSVLDLQSADELLELLGFQNGKITEGNQYDLVFVHIGVDERNNADNILENANNLVGRILQVAQPGSEVASRLHLTLILSYGTVTVDDPNLSLASLHDRNNSDLQSLFPRQSYTLKGVNPRNGIRHHCPALIAQWQDAVTRKDMAQEFYFSEFKKNCGNLAIAADRFIYETAFKLWKAPKYGA